MKHQRGRFQFSILKLLFLMAFVGLSIQGIGPISGYLYPPKTTRGLPVLSNIPFHSNATRSARLQAEPGYVPSGLIIMVTPGIVIEEEEEDPSIGISANNTKSRPIQKNP